MAAAKPPLSSGQARRHAISHCQSGRYKEKDIVKIAALKLQAEEGDYMADIHKPGFLEENIDNYIP
eukprot:1389270-Amorphochlora_amoeboformis.AAC.1